jgi:hypothetical protein
MSKLKRYSVAINQLRTRIYEITAISEKDVKNKIYHGQAGSAELIKEEIGLTEIDKIKEIREKIRSI